MAGFLTEEVEGLGGQWYLFVLSDVSIGKQEEWLELQLTGVTLALLTDLMEPLFAVIKLFQEILFQTYARMLKWLMRHFSGEQVIYLQIVFRS